MSNQIIIGYTTEGNTDLRFLESVIQRTFEQVAFECKGEIEVLPVIHIRKKIGPFVEQCISCCKEASSYGVSTFCIHVDADSETDEYVFKTRIEKLFKEMGKFEIEDICKNVVPVIPVPMIEAWM